jgi:tetratricopeptide (TPR) repeat protein
MDADLNPDAYADRLSEYLDEELDAAERAAIERHLETCAACRTTLDELRDVVTRASTLDDSAPAHDLWTGVSSRLAPPADPPRARPWRSVLARRFTFNLPQLAAAGLALMVLSGGLVWMARSGDPRADFQPVNAQEDFRGVAPANFTDAHYDEAIADLQQALQAGRTKLDAATVRALEDNLAAIDGAIEQCRRALAADPANVYLNTHLAEARQRKLSLLRRVSALANAGS